MFTYWDVSEDEDSGYYGENGNPANSLHFEITYGNNGLGPTYGYVIRHNGEIVNSVPATTFDDYWVAKDEMNEALPIDSLDDIGPDYDPSIYEKLGKIKTSAVFWGKATYGDDMNGYYGTEGDYTNSLRYMVGEMVNGNGFLVFNNDNDCLCEIDGFASDYEAQVGAEQWIEENASRYITASVKSASKIGFWRSFVGEYFYGVSNDKNKSFRLHIEFGNGEDGSLIYAEITSPYDAVVESRYFTLGTSRSEIEQWFADYCLSHLSSDKLLTASVRSANANWTYWNEYLDPYGYTCLFYGVKESPLKSIVITLPEKDGMYKYIISDNTSINDIVESDYVFSDKKQAFEGADAWVQEHAGEYLQQYEQQYAYSSHVTADEDSLSDDLDDMNNDDLTEDDMVPDAIASRRDIRSSVKKSSPELVFWGSDMNDYEGVEYYGENGDNRRSLELNGEGGWADDEDDYDYQVHVLYPTNMNSWDDAYTAYGDTLREAFDDAEKWCLENGSEYLYRNSDVYDVDGNRIAARRTFRTAKRKWTARERLALINEERLDGDDEFDDLI